MFIRNIYLEFRKLEICLIFKKIYQIPGMNSEKTFGILMEFLDN